MKKTVYVFMLFLTFFGGSRITGTLLNALTVYVFNLPAPNNSLLMVLSLPLYVLNLLILYRVYLFVKSRSIVVPSEFSGFTAAIGYLALGFLLLIIIGYLILFTAKASGISGIPLGFAIPLAALLSAISVFITELRFFINRRDR